MAKLRLVYSYAVGEFEKHFAEMTKPIAATATAAVKEAGQELLQEGRQNIAGAGFSRRFQSGYRVRLFPKTRKPVIDAVALGYFRIGYFGIFETGASIKGKPLLWVPLPSTPKKLNSKRLTPSIYREQIGPLYYVKNPGGRPLLFGKQSARGRSRGSTFSLASLRKGSALNTPSRSVPLFVGLDVANIRKRFKLTAIAERIADKLPELYAKHFKDDV